MGTKLEFIDKREKKYKKAVYDIGKILLYKMIHPWCIETVGSFLNPWFFKERKVLRTLHTFTQAVIEEREKNFSDIELPKEEHDVYKGKKRLAMLDLLLSAKRNEGIIDNEGIQEEVDTFMFEGHDTTSVALGFAFMLLANNKHIQVSKTPQFKILVIIVSNSRKIFSKRWSKCWETFAKNPPTPSCKI